MLHHATRHRRSTGCDNTEQNVQPPPSSNRSISGYKLVALTNLNRIKPHTLISTTKLTRNTMLRLFAKSICGLYAMAVIAFGLMPKGSSAFTPNVQFQTSLSARHFIPHTGIPLKSRKVLFHAASKITPSKMSQENEQSQQSNLPVFLDPGTKGAAMAVPPAGHPIFSCKF